MPTIDCVSPDLPDMGVRRALLAEAGPTIPVQIGHDPGFDEYADLKPVVPPDLYPALVDTGASGNSIDNELAVALRLPVVEYAVTVSGSVGEHTTNVYLAHIHIAEPSPADSPGWHWPPVVNFIVPSLAGLFCKTSFCITMVAPVWSH